MPGCRPVSRACLPAFLFARLAFAQTATVEGTILNSATHAGVPEASVTLWTQRGVTYKAATDASGAFRITGVQPGEYHERYEKSGFEELDRPGFGQPPLRVGMAGSLHIDAQLVPFATLRGRVLDADGKPAADVAVRLGWHDPTQTDADGRFELDQLRPGTYWLLASPLDKPSPANSDHTHLIPTYYPSTASLAEAERIQVRAGADLGGYEIRLGASQVFHVRGVVLDETGKPVPHANVRLLGPGEDRLLSGRSMFSSPAGQVQYFLNIRGVQNQEATTLSRDAGTFEFPAVRPGDWNLEAELDPQRDARNNFYYVSSGSVPASVSDRDIDNLELRFASGFNVEVAADWGAQPTSVKRVPSVMLVPLTRRQVVTSGSTSTNGALTFAHMLPGRYRVVPTPGLPPGFYASAVMLAGQDVLGQDVELTASTPQIRVVYKPNPGTIRGTVQQGGGATVLLWPEGTVVPEMVRAVGADSRGAFEATNVPPGDYSVIAFDQVSNQGGSESFVLGAVAAGLRVKVSEGSAETVRVPLTRWPD
jgi:protocatechuate 3,4-dioxygenase beta subunit